ncbi:MAG: hypothetical protein ACK5OA_14090 [Acidovorax sp.]
MKYLRRFLKALGWLMLALGALAAVGMAAVIVANWNDDPLSEAAQQALQYTPPTEQALEGNGYLILMGLDAPAEGNAVADATALGRKRLAREIERRRWVDAHGNQAEGMPPAIAVNNAAQSVLPDRLRCPLDEADCFAWFEKHGDEVQTLATTHRALLQRLAAAASAPQFSNPSPSYLLHELPPYGLLLRAYELWLAQASLAWMRGQPQQAMDIARQAMEVRSRLAVHSNDLVTSMVALTMQHRELRWLSGASAHADPQAQPEIAQAIEQLLSTPPPSLHQTLQGEMKFVASVAHSMKDPDPGFFGRPWEEPIAWWQHALNRASAWAFLPKQTLNLLIRYWQQVQALSTLPAHEVETAVSNAMRQWDDDAACSPWKHLRNATGLCLAASGMSFHLNYMQRIADIDGYRRLVLLQHRAAVEQIAPADMPAWLAQSAQALRNPYTLEPMAWDAATRSLVFEGREKQNQNPDRSSTYRVRLRG